LADSEDIEDVMLPYSEIYYENPLFVQLDERSPPKDLPKKINSGPKLHAVFSNGKAALVPEEH